MNKLALALILTLLPCAALRAQSAADLKAIEKKMLASPLPAPNKYLTTEIKNGVLTLDNLFILNNNNTEGAVKSVTIHSMVGVQVYNFDKVEVNQNKAVFLVSLKPSYYIIQVDFGPFGKIVRKIIVKR